MTDTIGWSEERIDLLKKWWNEVGLSASQIAGRLGGTTRNAVIGKVRRLGLVSRQRSHSRGSPEVEHRWRKRLRRKASGAKIINARLKAEPLPEVVDDSRAQFFGPGVTLEKRTLFQCSFIAGETDGLNTVMCGAPVKLGKSYCPHHHARMFVKPSHKKKVHRPDWSVGAHV